ncbi:hypothetical protein NM208_g5951 [Fusarium decemcellulare]|uniref:Uncharacterized protein n=1 Tax=Fusarium decemcellulare TaxID=57161 RepID=A0ACC1SF55_9HYPO|nr:hypothetical protein NM208_g5951 [Fusarium decemcellulare]
MQAHRPPLYRPESSHSESSRPNSPHRASFRPESYRPESYQRRRSYPAHDTQQRYEMDEAEFFVRQQRHSSRANVSIFAQIAIESRRDNRAPALLNLVRNVGPPTDREPTTGNFRPIYLPVDGRFRPVDTRTITVMFFRISKGKVVWSPRWSHSYDNWHDSTFADLLTLHYKESRPFGGWLFTKIKFVYFITVSQELRDTIQVEYTEVLQYKGPSTARRFMYLLEHSERERSWIRVLHRLASTVRADSRTEPFIMVEIVEALNTGNIIWLLCLAILVGILAGVVYGILTKDWGSAFTLSSLIVACLVLLLALLSANASFGLEKIIDDEISNNRGGLYWSHYVQDITSRDGAGAQRY